MADENDDGVDGLSWEIIYDPDGADGPAGCAAATECPDCGGTGNVPLLVAEHPCETCGGTGKAYACEGMLVTWADGDAAASSPDSTA